MRPFTALAFVPLTVLALAPSDSSRLPPTTIAAEAAGAATRVAARPEPTMGVPAPRYVREAQRVLRDLGYQPGPVDGVVGPRMKEALVRYQRAQKIAVTGRLDGETMVRLDIQSRLFPARARAR